MRHVANFEAATVDKGDGLDEWFAKFAIDPVLLSHDPLQQAAIQQERAALSDRPMAISLSTFRNYVSVLCRVYERQADGERLNALDRHHFPQLAAFLAPAADRSQQLETLRRARDEDNAERVRRRRIRSCSLR